LRPSPGILQSSIAHASGDPFLLSASSYAAHAAPLRFDTSEKTVAKIITIPDAGRVVPKL
jgi:hypothetical protein